MKIAQGKNPGNTIHPFVENQSTRRSRDENQPFPKLLVILSERGPRRTLQSGSGESKDLRLLFAFRALYQGMALAVPQ